MGAEQSEEVFRSMAIRAARPCPVTKIAISDGLFVTHSTLAPSRPDGFILDSL